MLIPNTLMLAVVVKRRLIYITRRHFIDNLAMEIYYH